MMENERVMAYRPDPSWGDLTRGAGRFDLLGLALAFLSCAVAVGSVLV